jgi:hypothetical protein
MVDLGDSFTVNSSSFHSSSFLFFKGIELGKINQDRK